MNFDQLEYFIAVSEEKNYYDAAERMHISQSSLSKQLINLEKELGIALFDRSHRKAELTAAGKSFYKEALALSSQYHKLLDSISDIREKDADTLRIGTLPFQAQYDLPAIFTSFSKAYPQIGLIQEEVEDDKLLSGFESGKYDLIIARSNMIDSKEMSYDTICSDVLVAVLPSVHPLCQSSFVPIKKLINEQLILMNPYTYVYKLCMGELVKAGLSQNVRQTARPESILYSVAHEGCVSLLPESYLKVFSHEKVVYRPLSPEVALSIVLIRKKKASSACISTFRKWVKERL